MTRLPLRLVGRLLGFLVASLFIGAIVSAIAAAVAKRRLVSIGGPEDDEVALVTIYGSLDFRSAATSFRRGSLLAWFAGGQLDLRGATLDPAGADLDVRTIFAGTNVVVPEGWRVTVEGPAIFGANSARAGEPGAGAPELRVRAVTVFGGTMVSAEAWDLAASEQTLVVAAEPGTTAPEPAEAVVATEATPGTAVEEHVAEAATVAPKRRRRRAAPDAAAADQPAAGDHSPAADPG